MRPSSSRVFERMPIQQLQSCLEYNSYCFTWSLTNAPKGHGDAQLEVSVTQWLWWQSHCHSYCLLVPLTECQSECWVDMSGMDSELDIPAMVITSGIIYYVYMDWKRLRIPLKCIKQLSLCPVVLADLGNQTVLSPFGMYRLKVSSSCCIQDFEVAESLFERPFCEKLR